MYPKPVETARIRQSTKRSTGGHWVSTRSTALRHASGRASESPTYVTVPSSSFGMTSIRSSVVVPDVVDIVLVTTLPACLDPHASNLDAPAQTL